MTVSSHFIPFVRIVLAMLVPLSFHLKFRLISPVSRKHLVEILIEIAYPYIDLGTLDSLTMFFQSMNTESLHLFRSSLISFISVL